MNPAQTLVPQRNPLPWWRRLFTPTQTASGLVRGIGLVLGASFAYYLTNRPVLTRGQMCSDVAGGGGVGPFKVPETSTCLIPKDQILGGGPAKDGIPALTNPATVPGIAETHLNPGDRVIGVLLGGEARAYPLRILNWHEIVNDTLGGSPIAVTYCPLCDSAVVFDRNIGGQVREFGVSGLLYNSNVLMYDRQGGDESKESLWSQMMLQAVDGPAAEAKLELDLLPAQLVTWEAWMQSHPGTTTLSFDTGHQRNYDGNPYEGYFATDRLMFPARPQGEEAADAGALPRWERVIVVRVTGKLKGYPVSRLHAALVSGVVTDESGGKRFTFTAVDGGEGVYRVRDSAGDPVPAAFTFWFEFRAIHPEAEVFSIPARKP